MRGGHGNRHRAAAWGLPQLLLAGCTVSLKVRRGALDRVRCATTTAVSTAAVEGIVVTGVIAPPLGRLSNLDYSPQEVC